MGCRERRRRDRPCRRRGPLLLCLPLALALAACSGTPFGEQLSGSFPDGQAPGAAAGPAAPTADAGAPPAAGSAPPATGSAPGAAGAPAGQPPAAGPGGTAAPGSATPAAPAAGAAAVPAAPVAPVPYRLTLRLSAADPAAPAEAVTRALRAAGLAFEVEVIERIPEGTAPAAPAGGVSPDAAGAPAGR